jgi:hypothetical protein
MTVRLRGWSCDSEGEEDGSRERELWEEHGEEGGRGEERVVKVSELVDGREML